MANFIFVQRRTGNVRGVFAALLGSILVGWVTLAPAADLGRLVTFDIPAQPLSTALLAYSDQAKIPVTVESKAVDRLTAPALNGRYFADRAWGRRLEGTGQTYQEVGNGTVAIRPLDRGDERAPVPAADRTKPSSKPPDKDQQT